MSQGLERLKACRDLILTIPAENFNMKIIAPDTGSDCGCALHHFTKNGEGVNPQALCTAVDAEFWELSSEQMQWLFNMNTNLGTYSSPIGNVAKAEFLSRISQVIRDKEQGV